MGISLSYIAKQLSFDKVKQLIKFLNENEIYPTSMTLDTKAALPILQSKSKSFMISISQARS